MPRTHRVTVEPLGQRIDCREDQTILDACLRAGIWLPHACTHGTCGTCKAEILDGEVDHGEVSSFALMDFERDEGKALLCCARPRSDVVVEGDVEVEPGVTTHPVRDFTATVAAVEDCAADTRRLLLDLDRPIAFNPGQYVTVRVPNSAADRSYSMAGPPSSADRIELNVRRTPGGLASDGWIFSSLRAGDEVSLSGPYGRFFWRPERTEPAVLVAGGTGLAPLMSMIRHVLEGDADRRLTLYHGGRTAAHMYNVDELRELARAHPERFRYEPCLSEQDASGYRSGLVTDVMAGDADTYRGHVAYVCGPPPMVDAAIKALMAKRLFPRDIYREDFFDASDRAGGRAVRSPLLKR
ncbi:2Fe-2S iron-sulfur cluster binding domain-containing protein [Thermopolyspora sp. NPDC052614]|uniref:NADH:ubiquinone reductase (Na(+)-transporting) subunit F n=1 Tax=Thermopolyspora sp. NPDC052614 TaxID=3155682 RepID=UPI003434FFF8